MKLHYEAVTKTGELIAGEMKATSEREALRLLSADGLSVLAVGEVEAPREAWFQRTLTRQEVVLAFFELATMLSAGVALAEAVESQSQSEHHPQLERFFEHLSNAVSFSKLLFQVLE